MRRWSAGTAKNASGAKASSSARLSHPHIARLIDAGVSNTGQPYLVLELVKGDHIDVLLRRTAAVDPAPRALVPRCAVGGVARAHQLDRASRSETVECAGRPCRGGEAPGFQHREADARRGQVAADAGGQRGVDAALRGARAGDRRPNYHGHRRLLVGRLALRAVERSASVWRRRYLVRRFHRARSSSANRCR